MRSADYLGMRAFLMISVVWFAQSAAQADFAKNFPATVSALETITNAHRVSTPSDPWVGKNLYRGSEPVGQIPALKSAGITHVLIFKNKTASATLERKELKSQGYRELYSLKSKSVGPEFFLIPFPWKEMESFKLGCSQVVDALRFIRRALSKAGNSAYFHCTAGEDRTGLLAGIYRMLYQKAGTREAFYGTGKDEPLLVNDGYSAIPPQGEMCGRGYEGGNPTKPEDVSQLVRSALTPLFTQLAYLIRVGHLRPDTLDDPKVCDRDPSLEAAYRDTPEFWPSQYVCPKTLNPLRIKN